MTYGLHSYCIVSHSIQLQSDDAKERQTNRQIGNCMKRTNHTSIQHIVGHSQRFRQPKHNAKDTSNKKQEAHHQVGLGKMRAA